MLVFFEPHSYEDIRNHIDAGQNMIVKVLIPTLPSFLDKVDILFNKKIVIIRDPRDIVISALLYYAGYEYIWKRTVPEIQRCLNLLRQKEEDPGSVSVLKLYEEMTDSFSKERLQRMIVDRINMSIDLAQNHGFFVIKYEDMIANKLDELENHLGFRIVEKEDIGEEYRRVMRTKSRGSWNDWFVAEDVAFFRPAFQNFLKAFDYSLGWSPSEKPEIQASLSSEYVLKLVNERRSLEGISLM